MPTLDWIGKQAVVKHHEEVPFHLLQEVPDLCVGDPGSGNLLVQGDNLLALKALLPYYAGQVKCIYIDPPYNTGNENWVYNDAVNSPEIAAWLGRVVGGESEDLSRHDKWLCMMYPRLVLLREFLREDGVIFVSIDDNEAARLRLVMDEIYGPSNCIGSFVWKRRSSSGMRATPLSVDHEYILAFGRDSSKTVLYGLSMGIESYPYQDERGRYRSTDLTVGMTRVERPNQFYPITNPRTGVVYEANPNRVWRFYPETMSEIIAADLVMWPDEVGGNMTRPRYRTYYDPNKEKPKPVSSWIETKSTAAALISEDEEEFDINILTSGLNQEGARELGLLFEERVFAYPKPVSLLKSLIIASTRPGDFILDSFAGSGTTAHAVLALNASDGERHFILVEMEPEIARSVAAERLARVIRGYVRGNRNDSPVDGPGGGFRYCTLGEPLFDAAGEIRPEVSFADLARHVFFVETGEPLPRDGACASPLLGVARDTAVYLLYNGILRDTTPEAGNVLTPGVLAALPAHFGPKVVYGTGCLLSEARLREEGVTFKQIPYAIATR